MNKLFAKLKDFDVKTCLGIIAFLGAFMLIFCAVFWSACAVQYAKADAATFDADMLYRFTRTGWTSATDYNLDGVNCFVGIGASDTDNINNLSGVINVLSVVDYHASPDYMQFQQVRGYNTYGDYRYFVNGNIKMFTGNSSQNVWSDVTGVLYIYSTSDRLGGSASVLNVGVYQKLLTLVTLVGPTEPPLGPAIDLNSYAVVPLDSTYWTQTAPATFGLVGAEVTNAGSYLMVDAINPYTVRMSVTYRHNTLDYDHTQIVLLANVGVTGSMKYYFIPFDEHYSDLTRIDIFFADDTLPAPVTQITSSSFFAVAGDNYTYMNYLITHSDLYQDGVQFAVGIAYDQGYEAGYTEQNNLISVMWESFSLPVRLLFGEWQVDSDTGVGRYVGGLFNFTILGVDIRAFVLAILTILILVSIVKFILGLRR